MAGTTETGHEKNVENFDLLITQAKSMGATYNPSNPFIMLDALEAKSNQGREVIKTWKSEVATSKRFITDRAEAYKNLKKLSTRVMKSLKGSGAKAAEVEDAKSWQNKIQGVRVEKPAAPKEGEKPAKRNSVSQQSFDMRKGNMEQMVESLKKIPAYKPNEEDLKVDSLSVYLKSLETLNDSVDTSSTALNRAQDARNEVLYKVETGTYDLAMTIKNYIYSADGTKGPVAKKVAKIKFTEPKAYK